MNKTEKQICEALIDLLEEKPLDKVKVTDVANRAEISRSTFYMYYESVYDVLEDIEEDILFHFTDEGDVKLRNEKSMLKKNFSYLRDNLRTIDLLLGPNGDPGFEMKLSNRSSRVMKRFARETESPLSEAQLAMVNEFSRAGKLQVLRWWSTHKDEVSVQDVINMFERMTLALNTVMEK